MEGVELVDAEAIGKFICDIVTDIVQLVDDLALDGCCGRGGAPADFAQDTADIVTYAVVGFCRGWWLVVVG